MSVILLVKVKRMSAVYPTDNPIGSVSSEPDGFNRCSAPQKKQ